MHAVSPIGGMAPTYPTATHHPLFSFFLLLCLLTFTPFLSLPTCTGLPAMPFVSAEAAAVGPELLFTNAAILSGGLDGCPTYNASTCTLGIAAFVARRRALTAQGIQTLPLPMLQRTSSFTKLHPLDWGFILDLYPSLGITTALSFYEISQRHFAMSYQAHPQWGTIVESSPLPVGHSMRRWMDAVYFDTATKVQVLSARLLALPIATVATNVVNSIFGAQTLGNGFTRHSVVLVHDTTPAAMLDAIRVANAAITKTGGFFPTVICRFQATTDRIVKVNSTWLVELKTTAALLHRLRIHEDPANRTTVVNVSIATESLTLPSSMVETDEYRRDQALIKVERDKAVLNNPDMGDVAGPMPAPRTTAGGYFCRERECAMGNLFTDAIRSVAGTDIGLFSGPWLQGPGWPRGAVTLRDLYGTYPWTEQLAQGRYLGLTLFELLNHTIQEAGFDALQSSSELATYHLMQVSGLRVTYTFGRTKQNRIVSIEVMNKATGNYEPLERLKTYTVAADVYLGRNSPLISLYLKKARYSGETGMALMAADLHRSIGVYLRGLGGAYVPGIKGRLINATGSAGTLATMQEWNHVLHGCGAGNVLNKSIGTCVACPAGFEILSGAAECTPIPPPAPLLTSEARVAVIAAAALLALALVAADVKGFYVWRRHQRLRYCPRDSDVAIAAFFVTVRNEVALRERHAAAADAALRKIEGIVVDAAAKHQCYVARKLKAHFLVVAKEASSAVLCAAAVARAVELCEWSTHIDMDGVEIATASGAAACQRIRALKNIRRSAAYTSPSARPSPGGSVARTVASAVSGRSASTRRHGDAPAAFEPRVAIGLTYGHSRIEYDAEIDVYSYSGPVLDAAVTVADLASDQQVLATEALITAAGDAARTAFDVEEFMARRMLCPLLNSSTDVSLLQCNVIGCMFRQFDAKGGDNDEAAGALAAALETAAGGLTTRRVGVISWTVPALRGGKGAFASRAEHAKASEAIDTALRHACTDLADVVSTTDGVFTVVVNGASVRTAQVAVSTIELARAGLSILADVTPHRAACGAAIGTSVTGTIHDNVCAAGVVTERARLLAAAAFKHPADPGLLVAEDSVADLEGYAKAAVDVIAWPEHCVVEGSKPRPIPNPRAVVLFTVEAGPTSVDADEWLYQLDAAARGNPHTAMNNKLISALGRRVSVAPTQTQALGGLAEATPEVGDEEGPVDYGVPGLVARLQCCHDAGIDDASSASGAKGPQGPTPVESFALSRTLELCFRFPGHSFAGANAIGAGHGCLPVPFDTPLAEAAL